ncbi:MULTISPECIES: phenylalanine--tRNA ligase subunit alpha [Halobacterium]|uniref:phenylalanine--tRNA ligase subunit alpha n=1 Tax=Halobacterium TaxID=2239 RepID=UPI001964854D|nr:MULTISPECIES: phenylalanine--tRNA ligase subunit alpha [Halobacterium]MCF2164518.1 phenylalanine--tRNA ligase subunit alpha [Halobacterium salinarum]MCF2167035.1 phenylalanine--tRNA ligase subunit alpha [Halobacterium salinarum]MCF2239656.1 phenylalanine--tRNA ligase subunit alpha [Halobacterium salinarum]QRY22628.1 phenylalanine--tRNA ligase subunit alpha [Halobacterium sp. GSL-19]WJK63957.1 phenylalanine--tRNA ligase subunit alpha [Halobacterium salinarum]
MQLPTQQVAVLDAASTDDPQRIEALAADTDYPPETIAGAALALEAEGLVAVTETTTTTVSLTDEGHAYATDGLPEVRLYRAALDAGADDTPVEMGHVIGAAGLDGAQVDIALSNYARKGYGTIDSGALAADPDADPDDDPEANALATLAAGDTLADDAVLDQLASRDLVTVSERTVRSVTLTEAGVTELMAGVEATDEVGELTPELLASGEWADVEFADYNVAADAADHTPGKTHVLRQAAERVTDVLVGMGFQEMAGPHVDADFYINDCLFMPQDHPARNHWDRFALSNPARIDELPDALVERVERAHREGAGDDGDGYHSPWDEDFARALALRGHTTSLTARHLAGLADADVEAPARYFSVEKAYRNDTLDATHLLEFFQIEGWVLADDLSVRDLMGTFREFYSQFGIHDLQFKPTYNPYTEPSFELFGRHPETGELIEIGNSGIFRPEMLDPLDVDGDVMAWGLALERLLMLMTGFEDIRDVHGTLCDVGFLRNAEVVY